MELEYIFIVIGVLTFACNIVLTVYLIKDNRADRAEHKSNTKNKSFITNIDQSNLVLKNRKPEMVRSREDITDTEIL